MWEKMEKTHTATLSYPASVFMALWIVLVFIIYVTVLCIFTEGMNPGMPIKKTTVSCWTMVSTVTAHEIEKQVVELVHVSGTTKLPKQGHLIQS